MRTITILCLFAVPFVLAGCGRVEPLPPLTLIPEGETRVYAAPDEVGGYGETLSRTGTFDYTYAGARVFSRYYPEDNEFRSWASFDGYFGPARNVVFEISLSNGEVLTSKPIKKLAYGDYVPIIFKVSDSTFESWSATISVDE